MVVAAIAIVASVATSFGALVAAVVAVTVAGAQTQTYYFVFAAAVVGLHFANWHFAM